MEESALGTKTSHNKDSIISNSGSNNCAVLSFENLKYYEPDSSPTRPTPITKDIHDELGETINDVDMEVEVDAEKIVGNNSLLEGSNEPQPSTSKGTKSSNDGDQGKRKRARKDSGSSWSVDIIDDVDTEDTDSDNWNFTDEDEIERQEEIKRRVKINVQREMEIFKARILACGIAGVEECLEQNSGNCGASASNSRAVASTSEQQPQNVIQPPASPDYVPVSQAANIRGTANSWDNNGIGLEPPDLGPLNSEEEVYFDELEVASVSDINDNPIEDVNSSSNDEEPSGELDPFNTTFISKDDLELEDNFADGERQQSDSECERNNSNNNTTSQSSNKLCSTDSELSDRDKWTCSQCHAKCLPFFRYCVRCFRIRRNWLPKRPKSRRLKRKNTQRLAMHRMNNSDEVSSHQTTRDQEDNRVEKAQSESFLVPNTTSSSSSRQLPSTDRINLNEGFLVCEDDTALARSDPCPGKATHEVPSPPDSQEIENELNLQLPLKATPQLMIENSTGHVDDDKTEKHVAQEKSKTNSKDSNLCTLCYSREKDAAFVHNKIAHHFCCFSCADKILKRDGKCPICRDRVLRVVKIISA